MRCLSHVLAAALLLVPVAAAAADQDEYAGIHTVSIVYTLGDTLQFTIAPRLFALGGVPRPANISSWNLKDHVTRELAQLLGQHFAVREAPLNGNNNLNCAYRDDCADKLPRTAAIDAYVLIYKAASMDPVSGNGDIGGIGLYHHQGLLGLADIYAVYAVYGVAVIDAKSGAVIDYGTSRSVERVDDSVWPQSDSQLTEQQSATIRAALFRGVDDTLPHALANAKLIPGGG